MQTSTIKKTLLATVIGLASSAVIAAVAVTPATVNPVLAAISKSLKSPELNVSANIKEVSIAADTVELLKGSLRLKAVGSVNTIKGVIKFDYQNDGSTPKTVLSARVA
jgi:type III secretory pathway component EscU